jgi:hypothetical protein
MEEASRASCGAHSNLCVNPIARNGDKAQNARTCRSSSQASMFGELEHDAFRIVIARSRWASGRTPVFRRALGDVAIHGVIGLRRWLWIATLRSR